MIKRLVNKGVKKMKVLNERVVEIIKELIDLGMKDFSYYSNRKWGINDRVDVTFEDDGEQKVTVEIKL